MENKESEITELNEVGAAVDQFLGKTIEKDDIPKMIGF